MYLEQTPAVRIDNRTDEEKAATVGFVVATDSFMSGWGQAAGRSIFAVPIRSWQEADTVERNMKNRSEMKRVRVVGKNWRPRLSPGDHLSIRSCADVSRFYEEHGFCGGGS